MTALTTLDPRVAPCRRMREHWFWNFRRDFPTESNLGAASSFSQRCLNTKYTFRAKHLQHSFPLFPFFWGYPPAPATTIHSARSFLDKKLHPQLASAIPVQRIFYLPTPQEHRTPTFILQLTYAIMASSPIQTSFSSNPSPQESFVSNYDLDNPLKAISSYSRYVQHLPLPLSPLSLPFPWPVA